MSSIVELHALQIKLATRADLEDIWNLLQTSTKSEGVKCPYSTPHELMQRTALGGQIFFVAREGSQENRLLAAGALIRQQQTATIELVLQPDILDREVVGTALLTQIIQEARILGLRKLYAYAKAVDLSASIILIKLGFLPEGLLNDHFGEGTKTIIYGLKL